MTLKANSTKIQAAFQTEIVERFATLNLLGARGDVHEGRTEQNNTARSAERSRRA